MGKKCHWLTMAYGLKNDDGADDDDCYRFWRALFRKIICTRRRIPYGPDVNCFRLRPYLNAVEISSKKVWHGNEWPQWCVMVPGGCCSDNHGPLHEAEMFKNKRIAERYQYMRNDPSLSQNALKISRNERKAKIRDRILLSLSKFVLLWNAIMRCV